MTFNPRTLEQTDMTDHFENSTFSFVGSLRQHSLENSTFQSMGTFSFSKSNNITIMSCGKTLQRVLIS